MHDEKHAKRKWRVFDDFGLRSPFIQIFFHAKNAASVLALVTSSAWTCWSGCANERLRSHFSEVRYGAPHVSSSENFVETSAAPLYIAWDDSAVALVFLQRYFPEDGAPNFE